MKEYDHSFHAFIQGIILLGFALFMLGLILTGNVVYYIAPTMMPFIYFSLAAFFLLGTIQIFRSTKKDDHEHESNCGCEHEHQIRGPVWLKFGIYSIFILPILFGFVLPDRGLDSSVASNRGIQYGAGIDTQLSTDDTVSGNKTTDSEKTSGISRAEAYLEDPEGYMETLENGNSSKEEDIPPDAEVWNDDYYETIYHELINDERIEVTDENYLDVMTVLDIYLDKFLGREIEIIGFAYREPDFPENQLVAARFAMTCCTADTAVYGTLIESDQAVDFDDDVWFRAVGTINKRELNERSLPLVKDAQIQEIEEPESPYVYPSY
ncbi:TIGR03943 family protein [Salipaludibacillus neizhouensis]|uniref:TIGR03943 family protein n=1 Tax=Salipaludibacillus neizhouensis TaxID=885475 RepID=A0A3A9KB26_9BACI|nr:TIGR03943 family protein [Salipaludibacillus neizhouensis]RKL67671.1 TIGR03943 family protein [Salipaludibacillus neizhouensis]